MPTCRAFILVGVPMILPYTGPLQKALWLFPVTCPMRAPVTPEVLIALRQQRGVDMPANCTEFGRSRGVDRFVRFRKKIETDWDDAHASEQLVRWMKRRRSDSITWTSTE